VKNEVGKFKSDCTALKEIIITLNEVYIFTEYYGHSKRCSDPNFPLYDLEFRLRKQLSSKPETH
jgi:hypothetical protein